MPNKRFPPQPGGGGDAHSDETTEMNRAQVVIGCRSITHPGGFNYGKFLAEHTLLFVYAMCYSCLAPLILPAGFSESSPRRAVPCRGSGGCWAGRPRQ